MAKIYKALTEDGMVEILGEVMVEVSEDVEKKHMTSLEQFDAMLAKEKELRDGYIASIATMEAERPKLELEAKKVELKVRE